MKSFKIRKWEKIKFKIILCAYVCVRACAACVQMRGGEGELFREPEDIKIKFRKWIWEKKGLEGKLWEGERKEREKEFSKWGGG